MSRLTKERTKVSVERTHLRGEKKDSNFSLFNSLSLSLSKRKKRKRRKRTEEEKSSLSRLRIVLCSLSMSTSRERELCDEMRGKKRIKFPPKEGTLREKKSTKKRITEDAHLNGSCSVGVMTKPFSEDILFFADLSLLFSL